MSPTAGAIVLLCCVLIFCVCLKRDETKEADIRATEKHDNKINKRGKKYCNSIQYNDRSPQRRKESDLEIFDMEGSFAKRSSVDANGIDNGVSNTNSSLVVVVPTMKTINMVKGYKTVSIGGKMPDLPSVQN